MSNYLTGGELSRIYSIVTFLNREEEGHGTTDNLSVEVKVYDANGEPLGVIAFSDAGYAFYPGEPNES
jgi:hypothetical protein